MHEDLINQIQHLKQRIADERELSFSHLDMVHNVLPILKNMELVLEQNAKLMEALADIANGHVRNITNVDECEHGKYGYESCEVCLMEFAEAALTPQPENREGKE